MTQTGMAACRNIVEPLGAGNAYPCSLGLPVGHAGPCAAAEIPATLRARGAWEAAMNQAQPVAPSSPVSEQPLPTPAPMQGQGGLGVTPQEALTMTGEAARAVLSETQGAPQTFWEKQARNEGAEAPPRGFLGAPETVPPQEQRQVESNADLMAEPTIVPERPYASVREVLFMLSSQIAGVASNLPDAPIGDPQSAVDKDVLASGIEDVLRVEATRQPRNAREWAVVLADGIVARGLIGVTNGSLAGYRCPRCSLVLSHPFDFCPGCHGHLDPETAPWEEGLIEYRPINGL